MNKRLFKNLVGIICLLAGGINLAAGISQMNMIVVFTGIFFIIGGVLYIKQARKGR